MGNLHLGCDSWLGGNTTVSKTKMIGGWEEHMAHGSRSGSVNQLNRAVP